MSGFDMVAVVTESGFKILKINRNYCNEMRVQVLQNDEGEFIAYASDVERAMRENPMVAFL
jgi:hypothetical protein